MTNTLEFTHGQWHALARLVIAAASLLALPALTQAVEPEKTCRLDVNVAPDVQIQNCSFLIQSTSQSAALAGFYLIRGRAFNALQDYAHAMADFNEAVRLDPKSVMALTLRGDLFVERRDYDQAIKDFEQAIELDPNSVAAFADRGLAWAGKNEISQAITDYSKAIKLNPNLPVAFNNRGLAHVARGETSPAVADFSEAIRLEPRYASAYNNRANAHMALGHYDLAIADFDATLKLQPTSVAALAGRPASASPGGLHSGPPAAARRCGSAQFPGVDVS
jgi:tetratricopeptide (TPR) repeat protein